MRLVIITLGLLVASNGEAHTQDQVSLIGEDQSIARIGLATDLNAPAVAAIERGDIAGGRTQFETTLADVRRRFGSSSVEAADVLSMFSMYVYLSDSALNDNKLNSVALDYSKQAVQAYRAAFGPMHPEVARELEAYANILVSETPDNPSSTVDAALLEALQIRRTALGEKHRDTRRTARILAEVRGLPGRTRRDPVLVTEAANEFEKLIGIAPMEDWEFDVRDGAPALRFNLASMYARNGKIDQAVSEAAKARKLMLSWPVNVRCNGIQSAMARFERALPQAATIGRVRDQIIEASPTPCERALP